jgi:hypothetical protein
VAGLGIHGGHHPVRRGPLEMRKRPSLVYSMLWPVTVASSAVASATR